MSTCKKISSAHNGAPNPPTSAIVHSRMRPCTSAPQGLPKEQVVKTTPMLNGSILTQAIPLAHFLDMYFWVLATPALASHAAGPYR
eukprot:79753-Pelagomonas_calceolata.AAC.10